MENKRVLLKRYVTGFPKEEDMEVVAAEIPLLSDAPEGSKAVVVKNLYLSCDPYMRSTMSKDRSIFVPRHALGEALAGWGVAQVIESRHPSFKEGDLVAGYTSWETYSLIQEPERLSKIPSAEFPLSYYTGILGVVGLSAYVGFYDICSAKRGEAVLVSAASGAVGQIVGQFAKLMGCYVVGSAGSDDKVTLLTTKLGFDKAFNYKKEHEFDAAVRRYFPGGIDVYFDNVGGAMLDAVLPNMNTHGRICACGMISQYNLEKQEGVHNLIYIISKCIRLEGFRVDEHLHRYAHYLEFMEELIRDGKIVYVEDIAYGLERAPAALVGLFSGRNVGKQVLSVCP